MTLSSGYHSIEVRRVQRLFPGLNCPEEFSRLIPQPFSNIAGPFHASIIDVPFINQIAGEFGCDAETFFGLPQSFSGLRALCNITVSAPCAEDETEFNNPNQIIQEVFGPSLLIQFNCFRVGQSIARSYKVTQESDI